MSFDVPPIGPANGARGPRESAPASASGGTGFAAALNAAQAPDGPPEEVLAQVEAAARRYDELAAQGRVVHFHRAAPGRVRIEVQDPAGQVLGALRPGEAVDVALGHPVR